MESITLEKLDLNTINSYKLNVENELNKEDRMQIASGLQKVVADYYYLMLKTHNYHWNVRGSIFYTLHTMTEEQYNDLFEALDVIAERVRSLGFLTIGKFSEMEQVTTITEGDSSYNHKEMIADLIESHNNIQSTLRQVMEQAAEKGDESTADLMTERLRVHEKTLWMLRSLLEK